MFGVAAWNMPVVLWAELAWLLWVGLLAKLVWTLFCSVNIPAYNLVELITHLDVLLQVHALARILDSQNRQMTATAIGTGA